MGAYRIYEFDGVELPEYSPERDESPGAVPSPLRATIGGMFDLAGSRRLTPMSRAIKVSGMYYPEFPDYLTTDTGDYIVDDAGNNVVAYASQAAAARDRLDSLTSRIGMLATLKRYRWDNTALVQTCQARLLSVTPKFNIKTRTHANEVALAFETNQMGWWSASALSVSASNGTLTAGVGGNLPVRNTYLAITASATITSIRCRCPETGCDFSWSGTLTAGQVLAINCQNQTVRTGTTDRYSGFSLNAGHTALSWLELQPGKNSVNLVVNGGHSATLSWYDVYA